MEKWSAWRKANYGYFKEKLKNFPSSCTLIDLGCGPTKFRDILTRFNYIGVDIKPFELVSIIADFTEKLPIENESADIIFISNILEHCPTPEFTLSECKRILKKGGVLLGSVPFIAGIHQEPFDYFRYTEFALQRLLTGFSNVEIEIVARPHIIYKNLVRQLSKHISKQELTFWQRLKLKLWRRFAYLKVLELVEVKKDFPEGYLFMANRPK